MTLPENPENNQEASMDGVIYKYNAMLRSWTPLNQSNETNNLATDTKSGLMSKDDYIKLTNLLIPPPQSTITSDGCSTVFKQGMVSLRSTDNFVKIETKLPANAGGESMDIPYKIHQYTYGYNFRLDLDRLHRELLSRNQLNIKGKTGEKGDDGQIGDDGEDYILTGQPGPEGDPGESIVTEYSVEAELFTPQIKPGLKKAIVSATIEPNQYDNSKYEIVFQQQNVGKEDAAANYINIKSELSNWVLVVETGNGLPETVYHLDLNPIINTIRDKFLEEVELLRLGYQDIVKFWLQKMSDLFDEQKLSLCCALEFCRSASKNNQIRQHLEHMAALTLGKGKPVIKHRSDSDVTRFSGRRLLSQIGGGSKDVCDVNEPLKAQAADNIIVLNAKQHNSPMTPYTFQLNPGAYNFTIVSTSISKNSEFFTDIRINYYKDNKLKQTNFLNKGKYSTIDEASNAYVGLSLQILNSHNSIQMWCDGDDGEVALKYEKLHQQQIIPISAKIIKQLALQWNSKSGSGLLMNIDGQDYIFMKSKVDGVADEVYVAWPSLDGKLFMEITENKYNFFNDTDLTVLINNKIKIREFRDSFGDISDSLNILFPNFE